MTDAATILSPESNPALFIRTKVFGCESQQAYADLIGVSQASVSRWEQCGRVPGHRQGRIREKAHELSLTWDDRYFFEVPKDQDQSPPIAPATPSAWEDDE